MKDLLTYIQAREKELQDQLLAWGSDGGREPDTETIIATHGVLADALTDFNRESSAVYPGAADALVWGKNI
jgi:hypothetical protein